MKAITFSCSLKMPESAAVSSPWTTLKTKEGAHTHPSVGICFPFLHLIKHRHSTEHRSQGPRPPDAPLLTGPAYLSLRLLGGPLKNIVTGEVRVLGETQLAPELQL